MFPSVDLFTLDETVSGPLGMVYSTSPRTGTTKEGGTYFVKGPDQIIAFAELAGCLLARAVDLTVPPVAVCHFAGHSYCGTQEIATIGRNVLPWLKPDRAANFDELYAAIVVDAWMANVDRNAGNVVCRAATKGRVELVMIDFEKSAALRPNPLISSTMTEPQKLWPSEEIGLIARKTRPLHPPAAMIARIKALCEKRVDIEAIITAAANPFGPLEWSSGCVDALIKRGLSIQKIAGEVWSMQ
jgi:hypothetical protein